MNKSFARFAAAGLAAVSFFAFSACGGQNPGVTGGGGNNPAMPDYGVGLSVVGTVTPDPNAPTEEPTEAPSEAPTADPTATPIPEGWIIDPTGNIPQDVEIIGLDNGITFRTCISTKDGKYYCQTWDDGEILWECEVPRELAEDFPKLTEYGEKEHGICVIVSHNDGTDTIYYKTEKGVFLMRGIPRYAMGGQYELRIDPRTLVWFNHHWDSYYYQKTYPKEIEYLEGYNLWVWAGTEELIPVNFEQTGEKINFPQ